MNSRMFKHFLVVAAAFLLVASVISAETNAPLLPTQSGAVPAGPGSDEDFEALADMHDEEVEDADAEESSDLDGVSAARAVLYFALKFIILP
jgi:hypothetical protein